MYVSAIFVIICVLHIHSVRSGLITERLKLSQVYTVKIDVCPPGVWTCSTGKRSEIVKASRDTKGPSNEHMFTAGETTHFDGHEDPQDCPPGMWVCKKKRMLKQMLKTALMKSDYNSRVAKLNSSQPSNDACPPGIWTCSTGKRSEITKEA